VHHEGCRPKHGTREGSSIHVSHNFSAIDKHGRHTRLAYDVHHRENIVLLDEVLSVESVKCYAGRIVLTMNNASSAASCPISAGSFLVGSSEWGCLVNSSGTLRSGLRVKLIKRLSWGLSGQDPERSVQVAFETIPVGLGDLIQNATIQFSTNQMPTASTAPKQPKAMPGKAKGHNRKLSLWGLLSDAASTVSSIYDTATTIVSAIATGDVSASQTATYNFVNWNYDSSADAAVDQQLSLSGNTICTNCYAHADFTVDFQLDITSYTVTNALMTGTGSASVNIEVQSTGSSSFSQSVAQVTFPSMPFTIGPIPFNLAMGIDVVAAAQVEADIDASASASGSVMFGMQYSDAGGVKNLHSNNFAYDGHPTLATATSQVQATISLIPSLTLTVDLIGGVKADFIPALTLAGDGYVTQSGATGAVVPATMQNKCPQVVPSTYVAGMYVDLGLLFQINISAFIHVEAAGTVLIDKTTQPWTVFEATKTLKQLCLAWGSTQPSGGQSSGSGGNLSQPVSQAGNGSLAPQSLWSGYYGCGGDLTDVVVQIDSFDSVAEYVTATLSFNNRPQMCTGVYTMTGSTTGNPGAAVSFVPDTWLSNPCGFLAVGLAGTIGADGTTVQGDVQDSGCTTFLLSSNGISARCLNDGVCEVGEDPACPDCVAAINTQDLCDNSCAWPNDGYCDDGGSSSYDSDCVYGSDCGDCGSRPKVLCDNTCVYSYDGMCDDGGTGSDGPYCAFGTDCADCGNRDVSTTDCSNTCGSAYDGECDDGGPGSMYSVCSWGTDCSDCGSRALPDCNDDCGMVDGICDDGATGAGTSMCVYGTDCTDCGARPMLVGIGSGARRLGSYASNMNGSKSALKKNDGVKAEFLEPVKSRELLSALPQFNCSSATGGCGSHGFCNTTTGVCRCYLSHTGEACTSMLPPVSAPPSKCMHGSCIVAKGLRTCAHINNKNVCASSLAEVLAKDRVVSQQLMEHFWSDGMGCLTHMRHFLCLQHLPVCNADSTLPKMCYSVCQNAFQTCGYSQPELSSHCGAMAGVSVSSLAAVGVTPPTCTLAQAAPAAIGQCALMPNSTVCPATAHKLVYVDSLLHHDVLGALDLVNTSTREVEDRLLNSSTFNPGAKAHTQACRRALMDVQCASLLPQCEVQGSTTKPLQMCTSTCVDGLRACSSNKTLLSLVCSNVFNSNSEASVMAKKGRCGFMSEGVSSFAAVTHTTPSSGSEPMVEAQGVTLVLIVVASAIGGVLATLLAIRLKNYSGKG
jgi:hypothetical protein